MKVLVTGASGDLGSRVAGLLVDALPRGDLILTSRNPSALDAHAERGADVRYASFDEPTSLSTAFAGAERMLLVSTGIVGEERRRQHVAALEAARGAGVRHIIYTSSIGMKPGNPSFVIPDHMATEAWLNTGGVDHTLLRMGSYADILVRAIAPNAIVTGQWISHAGDGRVAFVAKDDCARAAAAALTKPAQTSAVYEITGPELLSYRDAAAIASEVTGRPIEYIDPPPATTPDALKAQADTWIGAFSLAQLNSYEYAVRDGFYEVCTRDVETLTGRSAQSLRDVYRANMDALLGAGG